MIKADIEFCGDGEIERVERLMKVYSRIDVNLRNHIKRLEDHKGCLTAHVNLSSISVYKAIADAWEAEQESYFIIKRRDEVVCECS